VERPYAMIFKTAWPITTVSPAANTYCVMDGLSSHTHGAMGPRVQFSGSYE